MRRRFWSLAIGLTLIAGCQQAADQPTAAPPSPPTATASGSPSGAQDSATPTNASQGAVSESPAAPAGWATVDWEGIRIAFPPDSNPIFQVQADLDDDARASAFIQPTCPLGNDCLPGGRFRLYASDGEDPRDWIARTETAAHGRLDDHSIDGRKGVVYVVGAENQGLGGPETHYVVPVGSDILEIMFWGYNEEIVDYVDLDPAPRNELTPSQQAKVAQDADLWTAQAGGEKASEHPQVHRGLLVTVLELAADAAQVRTVEGTVGWIRLAPAQALTSDLSIAGDEARFQTGQSVVLTKAIPLRAEPNSQSEKRQESVAVGTAATLEEVRGDWVRVRLADGNAGWLRWRFAANQYVTPK